jgi:stage II sporulation protein M
MIIKATALAFFTIVLLSMFLAALVFSTAPELSDWFRAVAQSERRYIAIPPPFTESLYFYIFLNNVGHFWNPLKMLVWVPFLGVFLLGLELLLNGGVIGIVAVIAGITHGIFYPILGLTPHGILEIPAFILQFASLIRWHITTIDAVMAKIIGEKVESAKFKQGVKDTLILAVASVILFMIAAAIETYITPYLLGM